MKTVALSSDHVGIIARLLAESVRAKREVDVAGSRGRQLGTK